MAGQKQEIRIHLIQKYVSNYDHNIMNFFFYRENLKLIINLNLTDFVAQ